MPKIDRTFTTENTIFRGFFECQDCQEKYFIRNVKYLEKFPCTLCGSKNLPYLLKYYDQDLRKTYFFDKNHKYYGLFQCESCNHYWSSGNSWLYYCQRCKYCEKKISAQQLIYRIRAVGQRGKKPHDEEKCEKCQELGYSCKQKEERDIYDENTDGKIFDCSFECRDCRRNFASQLNYLESVPCKRCGVLYLPYRLDYQNLVFRIGIDYKGFFECNRCKYQWISNKARLNVRQECESCQHRSYAYKLQYLKYDEKHYDKKQNNKKQNTNRVLFKCYFICVNCDNQFMNPNYYGKSNKCSRCKVKQFPYRLVSGNLEFNEYDIYYGVFNCECGFNWFCKTSLNEKQKCNQCHQKQRASQIEYLKKK